MGCGCRQRALPRTAAATAPIIPRTYRNTTDAKLVARNPRISIEPRETINVTVGMISHTVRNWIRTGALIEA